MIRYEVSGNEIYREGVAIARINVNSTIDFIDDDAARFAPQVAKFLAGIGRYNRETGEATYVIDEQTPQPEPDEPPPAPAVPDIRQTITSLQELLEIVAQYSGTAAPEVSPFWGSETPEVKEYLRRHAAAVNLMRDRYQLNPNLEEVFK